MQLENMAMVSFVRCEDCGSVPELIDTDSAYLVCDCNTKQAVDLPEKWSG